MAGPAAAAAAHPGAATDDWSGDRSGERLMGQWWDVVAYEAENADKGGNQDEVAKLKAKLEQLEKEKNSLIGERQNLMKKDVQSPPPASQSPVQKEKPITDVFGTIPKNMNIIVFRESSSTIMWGALSPTLIVLSTSCFPALLSLTCWGGWVIQFASIYDDGLILFKKKLLDAINNQDWDEVTKLSDDGGPLDQLIFQPLYFWVSTIGPDAAQQGDKQYAEALEGIFKETKEKVLKLKAAAIYKDKAGALQLWADLKLLLNRFARLANEKIPQDVPPLGEI
ncbi:hypothetical protein GUITHDRAFT_134286 [Guillardia theta CCMP2712]|uniref:Uncharacterized protein n=1 Tax=Guillardia theta (strain CCMP2712) TaxID=905079 RepID=L1JUU2_GUITC|nr:hypothetical protein GUITHDRAFT_134286 [Guillardia theta CCMP2712]EKX51975.1 hypothetical protein GUITHDRAFT_134286 [Guillardia theta CCMP2712]|eukprot:XP_005838955.1 hypothetical protein GUITHDRAFT_134286 [Guillardia theta CCMP2712]